MEKKFIIITTIYPKSKAISLFEKYDNYSLLIIGDKKSKIIENSLNLSFISIHNQLDSKFGYAKSCPFNHYVRKNIGYLYAFANNADVIYDTDDDNMPYYNWNIPDFNCNRIINADSKFINVYKYFSEEFIWPRGYPLELLNNNLNITITYANKKIGVWQGLSDGDPDVDSIYRLVFNSKIKFEDKESVVLENGRYCPFNSQNTSWRKEIFPLLYLPATVSFRFTDILRGYIAQRIMWEKGYNLGFHKATVFQERNKHNLMKDFIDEIECFTSILTLIELLDQLALSGDIFNDLTLTYEKLCEKKIVKRREINLLHEWIKDVKKICEENNYYG